MAHGGAGSLLAKSQEKEAKQSYFSTFLFSIACQNFLMMNFPNDTDKLIQ